MRYIRVAIPCISRDALPPLLERCEEGSMWKILWMLPLYCSSMNEDLSPTMVNWWCGLPTTSSRTTPRARHCIPLSLLWGKVYAWGAKVYTKRLLGPSLLLGLHVNEVEGPWRFLPRVKQFFFNSMYLFIYDPRDKNHRGKDSAKTHEKWLLSPVQKSYKP